MLDRGPSAAHCDRSGLSSASRDAARGQLRWYGDRLVDTIEQVTSGPVVIVGHSFGGAIALSSAPARLAARVVVSTGGVCRLRLTPGVLAATAAWLALPDSTTSRRLLQAMLAPGHTPRPALVEWMTLVARHARSSGAPGLVTTSTDTVPVAAATGSRDVFLPPRRLAPALSARLKVTCRVIDQAGHLVPEEDPRAVASLVNHALENGEGGSMRESPVGQIVILNGAPRAGKSSIAKEIQEAFDGVWMNLGLDRFKAMTPERFQPGIGLRPGGERPDLEPLVKILYSALYEAMASHSRLGVNVVADTTHHDHYSQPLNILATCARIVSRLPVLFVGVRCPIDVVMQRRIHTWGWGYDDDGSIPAPILRWQREVHRPGIYDIELDTSQYSPAECAELISERLASSGPATAFSQLAAASGAPN